MTTALTETNQATTPMQLLAIAMEKDVDTDKLERLMAMQERWEANQAAGDYAEALARFQQSCPIIYKGRRTNNSSYASYDDIMRQVKGLLAECGLTVQFSTEHRDDGKLTCSCSVQHGKHVHVSSFTCPVPDIKAANGSQQYGAALSYVKRYALCAALNIVVSDEDDDGLSMGVPITKDQALNIESLVADTNADVAKMLKFAGASSIDEIPAKKYGQIVQMLKAKVKK